MDISDVIERLSLKEESPVQTAGIEMRLEIEGMMCERCERRVAKALEKAPGVLSASADYHAGVVTLRAAHPLDADTLKQAIEAEDYLVEAAS